ncbi:hypothetical protein N6H18_08035 [Reichenbachiella agarivorans]|uniref:Uncharacterized protein n=1 Tax=Reichenbachiella agarivorans TaxID=2979464 RepID=A0ABY6CWR7_9BACT|nr:hypothetical protein [Reichenbachiella agarivorans]UXP33893.1 hypothetical protein N6H18_08035 [Reichenbachiella agarivorans]
MTKVRAASSHQQGDIKVKNLFEKFDEDVVKAGFDAETDVLEKFLKSDDTWFNTIFNSSF